MLLTDINVLNHKYLFKRKTAHSSTQCLQYRGTLKNNLQPSPEFFKGLCTFLVLFFYLKCITSGKDGEPSRGWADVPPGTGSWTGISAPSAHHIPLFTSPSPLLHFFCLSPHNGTQDPLAVVQIGCLALCTVRMGSIKAVVWYNGLIGFASTGPAERRKNTFGRMREREMNGKKPHKHGNVMSLGCLDLVLGCVELYGEFFNICECLSLKWSIWTQGPFEAKKEDFRSKARPSQASQHAEKLTIQCFIHLHEHMHNYSIKLKHTFSYVALTFLPTLFFCSH